jgi:hypothetical protein
VCDDYGGCKVSFGRGETEIGCMEHARCKFFDLQTAGKSQLAEQVLGHIGEPYDIKRESKDFKAKQCQRLPAEKARLITDSQHLWMQA